MPPKQNQIMINSQAQIESIFQQQFHSQIFYSRCQDTGQKPDRQKGKMFKQSLSKINSKKQPQILNLCSLRLGVNTIMKLISILQTKNFVTINLGDNSISEYGMHAIKSLISSSKIQNLNLASNMISQVGLSLILQQMIKNSHIKCLDLGILEGSIRKNSFGIDGARCLAAILLQNKTLQILRLQDNDIGINGSQIISIPLKRNKSIKQLKISQNLIKTQGAQYILNNAINLVNLDIGKNFIKSSIGPTLKKYISINSNLKKLNLQFNQLRAQGVQTLFQGIVNQNCNLEQLNLKGNAIGNNGILGIYQTIKSYQMIQKLKILDLSCNQLTQQSVGDLVQIMDCLKLTSLNISKNYFTDNGIIFFIKQLKNTATCLSLQKLDISSTKISEKAFIFLLQNLNSYQHLKYLKCTQNYISQKFQKVFIQLIQKNQTLIGLNLNGNRLSLSGVKGIKKIIDRNLKKFQQKQPSRMKSQIYNLKQKQKKVKQAQQKIQIKKKQLSNLEQTKNRLTENLNKLQLQQKYFKNQHEQLVKKKINQLEQITQEGKKKQQLLISTKQQKTKKVEEMQEQLKKVKEKRKALQYQLNIVQNQGFMIEKDFQRKIHQIK